LREALPAKIEALEVEQAAIEAKLADPETYRQRKAEVPGLQARLVTIASETEQAFVRWESLEARK